MPRGVDNSSGGQVYVDSDRLGSSSQPAVGSPVIRRRGPPFLLLRERVDGQPQGAAVPLPADFLSGAHRARVNPKDGQLYVSGMTGWGTYTAADGSFNASVHRRSRPVADVLSCSPERCAARFSPAARSFLRGKRRLRFAQPGIIGTARATAHPSGRRVIPGSPVTTASRCVRLTFWKTAGRSSSKSRISSRSTSFTFT